MKISCEYPCRATGSLFDLIIYLHSNKYTSNLALFEAVGLLDEPVGKRKCVSFYLKANNALELLIYFSQFCCIVQVLLHANRFILLGFLLYVFIEEYFHLFANFGFNALVFVDNSVEVHQQLRTALSHQGAILALY